MTSLISRHESHFLCRQYCAKLEQLKMITKEMVEVSEERFTFHLLILLVGVSVCDLNSRRALQNLILHYT